MPRSLSRPIGGIAREKSFLVGRGGCCSGVTLKEDGDVRREGGASQERRGVASQLEAASPVKQALRLLSLDPANGNSTSEFLGEALFAQPNVMEGASNGWNAGKLGRPSPVQKCPIACSQEAGNRALPYGRDAKDGRMR